MGGPGVGGEQDRTVARVPVRQAVADGPSRIVLIAALVVIEQMSVKGKSLSELRAPFERYVASGELNTRVEQPLEVIEKVADHYGAAGIGIDRLDGLTVDAGDWWFNLRASNTEPLLRLNLEAADEQSCEARVAEVRSVMAG